VYANCGNLPALPHERLLSGRPWPVFAMGIVLGYQRLFSRLFPVSGFGVVGVSVVK